MVVRNGHKVAIVVGITIEDEKRPRTSQQNQVLAVVAGLDSVTKDATVWRRPRQIVEPPG
jgi:hypothetical protein